jgi:hypothetical protein
VETILLKVMLASVWKGEGERGVLMSKKKVGTWNWKEEILESFLVNISKSIY